MSKKMNLKEIKENIACLESARAMSVNELYIDSVNQQIISIKREYIKEIF